MWRDPTGWRRFASDTEGTMENARCERCKGFTIETRAFPVRHCALPGGSGRYMAVVRIRRAEQTVEDWHLPCTGRRWASADEAHREAVDYAIRAINTGCFADAGPPVCVTV